MLYRTQSDVRMRGLDNFKTENFVLCVYSTAITSCSLLNKVIRKTYHKYLKSCIPNFISSLISFSFSYLICLSLALCLYESFCVHTFFCLSISLFHISFYSRPSLPPYLSLSFYPSSLNLTLALYLSIDLYPYTFSCL